MRGPAPAAPLLALALAPPGLWIGANLQHIRGRRGPREVTILLTGIVNGQFYVAVQCVPKRRRVPQP